MQSFNCQKLGCENEVHVSVSQLDENKKPTEEVVCIDCYIPKNPTTGWLITRAKKIKGFDVLKLSSFKDKEEKKRRDFCLKFLGIKSEKEQRVEFFKDR